MRSMQSKIGLVFLASYLFFVFIAKPNTNLTWKASSSQGEISSHLALPKLGISSIALPDADSKKTGSVAETNDKVKPKVPVSAQTNSEALPALPPVSLNLNYSTPQSAYMELDTITQNDERPENRLAAVIALRSMLSGGDAEGRIKESLRMATTDGDPRVAEVAQEAYKEALTHTLNN